MKKRAGSILQHSSAPTLHSVEVSAALIFRDGKILITQRHAKSHLGGLWEFPGGKREPGETFEQCLVRELREELGIEVEVGGLFEDISHAYAEKTVQPEIFQLQIDFRRAAAAWIARRSSGWTKRSWPILNFRPRMRGCWRNCVAGWSSGFSLVGQIILPQQFMFYFSGSAHRWSRADDLWVIRKCPIRRSSAQRQGGWNPNPHVSEAWLDEQRASSSGGAKSDWTAAEAANCLVYVKIFHSFENS